MRLVRHCRNSHGRMQMKCHFDFREHCPTVSRPCRGPLAGSGLWCRSGVDGMRELGFGTNDGGLPVLATQASQRRLPKQRYGLGGRAVQPMALGACSGSEAVMRPNTMSIGPFIRTHIPPEARCGPVRLALPRPRPKLLPSRCCAICRQAAISSCHLSSIHFHDTLYEIHSPSSSFKSLIEPLPPQALQHHSQTLPSRLSLIVFAIGLAELTGGIRH